MTSSCSTRCVAASLFLLTFGPESIAQTRSEAPRFDEEAVVTAVEVPVRVLVKGQPLRDLTADQFVLYDGGKEQELVGFEVLDLSVSSESREAIPADPAPLAARRKFLLLIDLGFTRAHAVREAEAAAREFVEQLLHPSDLVAVGCYGSRRGLEVLVNFTSDRRKVLEVLDGLAYLLGADVEAPDVAGSGGRADPLNLSTPGWNATLVDVGRTLVGDTSLAEEMLATVSREDSLGAFLQRNVLANMASIGIGEVQAQQSTLVARFSDSLSDLSRATAGVPGEKHLVLFSSGFDEGLLAGTRFTREISTGSTTWLLAHVDEQLRELRRTGWAIHPVVPGQALNPSKSAGGLFHLAAETGGTLFEGFNDLSKAIGRLDRETSLVYLLTFQPQNLRADGSYRRLRVKLRDPPKGAKLRHRDGYYAPKAGAAGAVEAQWTTGTWIASGNQVDQLGVEVLALPLGREGDRSRVAFLVDVSGRGLLGADARKAGAELFAYAFDAEGRVSDFVASRVELQLAKHREALEAGGLQLVGELQLEAGHYTLRFGVRNLLDDRFAVKTREVEVFDGEGGRELYPPIFLPSPKQRGLLVWSPASDEPDTGERQYPFNAGGFRLTPSARTTVSSSVEARLALLGFDLEGGTIEGRLVSTDSGVALPVPIERLEGSAGTEGRPDVVLLRLDTSSLETGSYSLELRVESKTGTGDERVARTPLYVETG